MINMLEKHINNLTIEQVNDFAVSKNILLSENELNFTYEFIKKNWKNILGNPSLLDIDRYQSKYSQENFPKIKKLYSDYYQRFSRFL